MSRPDRPAPSRRRLAARTTGGLGQWLGFSIGTALILAVIGIGLALGVNARVGDRRRLLIDQIVPARLAALYLESALVNEETGVRGYVIAHQASFLVPYQAGLAAEARDYHALDALLRGSVAVLAGDATVVRARAMQWRRVYAAPVLSGTRSTPGLDSEGKSRFDAFAGR